MSILSLVLVACLSADQEIPENVAAVFRDLDARVAKQRSELEKQLAVAKKSRDVKKIKSTNNAIDELDKASRSTTWTLPTPFAVGGIGRLPSGGAKVGEVISKSEAVVQVTWYVPTVRVVGQTVLQGPDKAHHVLALFRGFDTSQWTDDSFQKYPGMIEFTGTEKLDSGETVLVAKPYDDSMIPMFREAWDKQKKKSSAK